VCLQVHRCVPDCVDIGMSACGHACMLVFRPIKVFAHPCVSACMFELWAVGLLTGASSRRADVPSIMSE